MTRVVIGTGAIDVPGIPRPCTGGVTASHISCQGVVGMIQYCVFISSNSITDASLWDAYLVYQQHSRCVWAVPVLAAQTAVTECMVDHLPKLALTILFLIILSTATIDILDFRDTSWTDRNTALRQIHLN